MGWLLACATVAALVLWSAGESAAQSSEPSGETLTWMVGAFTGFFASYLFVHVFVHELGHLVAAVVLRLPVVGFRVGPLRLGLERHIEGSAGHVMVNMAAGGRALRARVILMLVAGPIAELLLATFLAAEVGDTSHTTWVRAAALGFTVALVLGTVENLSPVSPLRGFVNDGRSALSWLVQPGDERAKLQLQLDLARLHAGMPQIAVNTDHRERVRSLTGDPRPEIASAAMKELFRSRPRGDDGWADVDVVTTYVARNDVPGDERAAIGGNYALSLALAQAATRRSLDSIPSSPAPVPDRIAELAEAAREAHVESLQARAALGLARIMQGRPKDAQSALIDVDTADSDAVRARAMAVRAIAEDQLGDTGSAMRLLGSARGLAADDAVVRMAGRVLAPVD